MTLTLKGVNKHVYNLFNALDYLYDVAIISSTRAEKTEDELDALRAQADYLTLATVLYRIERAILQYATKYGVEAAKDKQSWALKTYRLAKEAAAFLASCDKRYADAFALLQTSKEKEEI